MATTDDDAEAERQSKAQKELQDFEASSDEDGPLENADMGELDYDLRTMEHKIARGNKEREAGNKLFKQGKFKEAWKTYDRAFVYIYTSKEEWEAIDSAGRNAINQFKKPCHLNRGLCRMRCGDYKDAHWDFSEALRIDSDDLKGIYRRGLAQLRICQEDVAKEKKGQWWDLDNVEEGCEQARADLYRACRAAPRDLNIREAIKELNALRGQVKIHRKKYNADQRKLYSSFISNLDKDNKKKKEIEDKEIYKDMPDLERIRIE